MSSLPTVGLRDFDRGVVTTFAASLINVTVDGVVRTSYAVSVPSVTSGVEGFDGKVPVFFSHPEDVFQEYVLPCFVVMRTEFMPNFEGNSWYGYNVAPATGAEKIYVPHPRLQGVWYSGYNKYTERRHADPMDLGYDIQVMARYQHEGIAMMRHLMRYCRPPGFGVKVLNSASTGVTYNTSDVTITSTSELADVRNRMIAWTVSFTVKGELDHGVDIEHTSSVIRSLPEVTYQIKTE